MIKIIKIGVLGGTGLNSGDKYFEVAGDLARYCQDRGFEVVTCGAKTGLVGRFVQQCVELGVVQHAIVLHCERDNINHTNGNISYVDNIAERKRSFLSDADILIALPGGLGTIDEVISFLSSSKCGEHKVPILLCNQEGFYDSLLSFLEYLTEEKFLSDKFVSGIKTLKHGSFSLVDDMVASLS